MGFLRRLLGGGDPADASAAPGASQDEIDAEERARELELARFEQDRTDDLVRRQQRFAGHVWTPPAQGGERRADDAEAAGGDASGGA
jgi:hypothetical protein